MSKYYNSKKIILIILGFILLAVIIYFISGTANKNKQLACTMEAKLCPDGSAVGRSGPNCEFANCPDQNLSNQWLPITDLTQGISFQYPPKLSAEFISANQWPPKISIISENFTCQETLPSNSFPNSVVKKIIDNKTYCVETKSEGAAGSVYTNYVYKTTLDNKTITIDFTLQYPQCLNYDDPNKTKCLNERKSFDLDGLVNRIEKSIKFLEQTGRSGIKGTVLLGPTCPVEKYPPDPNCADRPLANAKIDIRVKSSGVLTLSTNSDVNGNFLVKLAPETYTITIQSQPNNFLPRCEQKEAIVTINKFTSLDIFCDTGIR